jgi:hypothetical protein
VTRTGVQAKRAVIIFCSVWARTLQALKVAGFETLGLTWIADESAA